MKKIFYIYSLLVIFSTMIITSCSDEDASNTLPPEISFNQEEPIFAVKVGKILNIKPDVKNVDNNTIYLWKIDGKTISKESTLSYSSDEAQSVFVTFQVITDYGMAEKELRIDVANLFVPEISLAVPEAGYTIIIESELILAPEIKYGDHAIFSWTVDSEEVGDKKDYTFLSDKAGVYKLILSAKNEDGEAKLEFVIKVCTPEEIPFEWMFEQTTYNIAIGRTAFIRPYWIKDASEATYTWAVDGKEIVKENPLCLFAYTPQKEGVHTVMVTMKNSHLQLSKSFAVNVYPKEGTYYRAKSASSAVDADHGYTFLPAPSQHINRGNPIQYASQAEVDVAVYNAPGSTEFGGSLGAYGGYVVVGFDHSIDNNGDYNIEIEGNAFSGSSEAGIVWVMQDENGNGKPDDTWYELKGSDYGVAGYIKDYAVTYYRPDPYQNVTWIDNYGGTGTIDFMHTHNPPSMYPRWINEDTYTLVGSRLPSKTRETFPGFWENGNFDWGYADNYSPIDMLKDDDNHNAGYVGNHFKISDAVTYDGQPANLKYIDFVKVQTALNVKAGWLGENSTEVGIFRDFNMIKKSR